MLYQINPKLPMRNKAQTLHYYQQLGFEPLGDYHDYLMLQKDQIEIHFFAFPDLKPEENDGQVYIRTHQIESLYQSIKDRNIAIHPNGPLEVKPWGQKEFSLLDPDHNLLTFGQSVESSYRALYLSPMVPSFQLAETRQFFVEVLGFKAIMDTAEYAIVQKDRHTIHLLPAGPQVGQMEFYLEVDDVDGLWETIRSRVQHLKVKPPFNQAYGMREIHLEVPQTNTLMFIGQAV
jgi:catechol 2,3-dioxygenase-like lactoylglutathione lyase family enzyme